MIDISNAENLFNEYIKDYDPTNDRIKLKINHIRRVAKNCEIIAKDLGLSQDEVSIAILLGYFHDLGRFEQVRIANTFSDKESGINHGAYSVKALWDNDKALLRKFLPDDSYDEVIRKAILNHNRARIEEGLNEKELLFAKLIRDADKLDIVKAILLEPMPAIFWYESFDDEKISDLILNQFINNHFINYEDVKSNADVICSFYAFVFDINFKKTLKLIEEYGYYDKFTQRVLETFKSPTIHEQMNTVVKTYKDYLNSMI